MKNDVKNGQAVAAGANPEGGVKTNSEDSANSKSRNHRPTKLYLGIALVGLLPAAAYFAHSKGWVALALSQVKASLAYMSSPAFYSMIQALAISNPVIASVSTIAFASSVIYLSRKFESIESAVRFSIAAAASLTAFVIAGAIQAELILPVVVATASISIACSALGTVASLFKTTPEMKTVRLDEMRSNISIFESIYGKFAQVAGIASNTVEQFAESKYALVASASISAGLYYASAAVTLSSAMGLTVAAWAVIVGATNFVYAKSESYYTIDDSVEEFMSFMSGKFKESENSALGFSASAA